MLAKELHSSPWPWKAGQKGQMSGAASAFSWRESTDRRQGRNDPFPSEGH